MLGISLNFDDFYPLEKYTDLQFKFLSCDLNGKSIYFEDSLLPKGDLKIKIHDNFVMGAFEPDTEKIITVNFENDFLMEEIPKMADSFFSRIKKGAKEANRYSPDEIKYFVLPIIESLNLYLIDYEKATYLSKNIQSLIMNETLKLTSLCETFYTNPYPDIKKKLPLRWKRTEIEYFFHLLRENNQLGVISNADLGRIIDNTIECVDDKNSGVFKSISGSAKHLSEFSETRERPQGPSNKSLRELFNDDFFAK